MTSSQRHGTAWQPIKTARKDGELILLAPQMVTASWDMGAENWLVLNIPLDPETRTIATDWKAPASLWFELMATVGGIEPTHWMAIPDFTVQL